MKILLFPFEGNNMPDKALGKDAVPFVHTLPDTALLGSKRPFFIPDFAPVCRAHLHLAVRICRLGRSISERFAHRYYDAMAPVVHFTAHPLLEQLQEAGRPWDVACGFDSSLSVGTFRSLPPVVRGSDGTGDADAPSYVLHMNGRSMVQLPCAPSLKAVDACIARVSQFYTLRQGDMLVLGQSETAPEVHIDDRLAVFEGPDEVLAFNVK